MSNLPQLPEPIERSEQGHDFPPCNFTATQITAYALQAIAQLQLPKSYGGCTFDDWSFGGCTIRLHFTDAAEAKAWLDRLTGAV